MRFSRPLIIKSGGLYLIVHFHQRWASLHCAQMRVCTCASTETHKGWLKTAWPSRAKKRPHGALLDACHFGLHMIIIILNLSPSKLHVLFNCSLQLHLSCMAWSIQGGGKFRVMSNWSGAIFFFPYVCACVVCLMGLKFYIEVEFIKIFPLPTPRSGPTHLICSSQV